MTTLKLFIDTHDKDKNTFPANMTSEGFSHFYPEYLAACEAEGVVPMQVHLGYDEGRAFCVNLATDADAVRRAHERVGLPFDSITEVTSATPVDTFMPLISPQN